MHQVADRVQQLRLRPGRRARAQEPGVPRDPAAFDGIELLEDTTAPDELADLAVNVQQEAELMLNADQTHVMRIVEAGINGDETIDDIVADWNEAWNRGVERYAPEA